MRNRFILSSWEGYEVDSSEFYAALEVEDVPRTIKVFTESPFIQDSFSCTNILKTILNAIDIASMENRELLDSINVDGKNIEQILDKHLESILCILDESKKIDSKDRSSIPYGRSYYDYIDKERIEIPEKYIDHQQLKEIIKSESRSRSYLSSRNPYHDALTKYERGWMTKTDLLELAIYIKFLIDEFPHLSYEFNNASVCFTRKHDYEEGSNDYLITLSGVPKTYQMQWYTVEEWSAVLESIQMKTKIFDHSPPI